MLLATTIGEHAFFTVLFGIIVTSWALKALLNIDTQGEVKKAANDRLVKEIERWLK